ncbi:hypothetical protein MAM1_0528d10850 [Mucor ambiguus]|uniref:Uncharacterized protein n=1 Tax=Mucor ambiguus TaxID=91626 RepID=A0A0C9MKJ8_9FUNG|nr:hypothetical protein MAM1_0528d10850 [Mucor ambiguus]
MKATLTVGVVTLPHLLECDVFTRCSHLYLFFMSDLTKDYKEATAALKRKFCQVYKVTTGKTHRTSTVPDLTPPPFELSKTQKEALKKGAEILNQACSVQSDIISSNLRDAQRQTSFFRLKRAQSHLAHQCLYHHPPPHPSHHPQASHWLTHLINPSIGNTAYKLHSKFKEEGQKHGFNLQTEIQRVLAIEGIMLLKKGQHCQKLEALISPESLLSRIRDEVMNKSVKFDNQHYLTLAGLLRDIGNSTDRKNLKIQLNRLYEKTSRQDGYIVKMFTDLLSNLPNLAPTSPVGELQLTANYLNPCLCHLFHHLEIDKRLIWLNRKDANTCECRPDGILSAIPRRNECITLGYLEVKASDVEQSNSELAFQDLTRLEILTGEIPQDITQIGGLLTKVDDLKRVLSLSEQELVPVYRESTVGMNESPMLFMEAVNP